MLVTDFRWEMPPSGLPPAAPLIVYWKVQASPPTGAFAIMVAAEITTAGDKAPRRGFTCGVEVEARENKPGWKEVMSSTLIRACLAHW